VKLEGKNNRINTWNKKHAALRNITKEHPTKQQQKVPPHTSNIASGRESKQSQQRWRTATAWLPVVDTIYTGRCRIVTTTRIFYGEVVSPLAMDTVWGPSKVGKVTPDLSPGMSSLWLWQQSRKVWRSRIGMVQRGCIRNKASKYAQGSNSYGQPTNSTNYESNKMMMQGPMGQATRKEPTTTSRRRSSGGNSGTDGGWANPTTHNISLQISPLQKAKQWKCTTWLSFCGFREPNYTEHPYTHECFNNTTTMPLSILHRIG